MAGEFPEVDHLGSGPAKDGPQVNVLGHCLWTVGRVSYVVRFRVFDLKIFAPGGADNHPAQSRSFVSDHRVSPSTHHTKTQGAGKPVLSLGGDAEFSSTVSGSPPLLLSIEQDDR
jgi:hypothetical protein